MAWKSRSRATRIARVAVLVGLASVLHAVEAVIPVPYVMPGAKLGLANTVALYAVLRLGLGEALMISFLRTLLGSLVSGTFLNVSYYLSTGGAIVSTIVMYTAARIPRERLSTVGVSIGGAATHNITQLLLAAAILRTTGVFFYLPYLLFFAVPTGIFTGLLAGRLAKLG
ncbi:MAG: Gx transporter family protein [Firmicutes bacterium]|nr:Gx transporter family protein [Candidatus Fermentithermobacillaceae bacterium]